MAATLLDLKTIVLDLSDHTSGNRVTTARLVEYINMGVREVDAMVQAASEQRPRTVATITLVADTEAYDLPDDFQYGEAVWLADGTDRYKLPRASMIDFDYSRSGSGVAFADNKALKYDYAEDTANDVMQIWFCPIPASAGSVTVWYRAKPASLSDDTDTLPLSWPEIARDYITYGATALVMGRDQDEFQFWAAKQAHVAALLEAALMDIDRGDPHRVIDVYGAFR